MAGSKTQATNGNDTVRLEPLMTVTELADYLNMSAGSVYNIIADITAADGKIMLRGGYRFIRKTVRARVEAGLFGRGLDQNGLDRNGEPVGEPVTRNGKRKDKVAIEVSPTRGAFD
ncbi:MAG TPA: hypothetical protein VGY99_19030 [Candidatus Binataceae bacterium]|jgi:hypothetical protein|nr:hypothetical protein [Candidatus Binataceae bacterium]